MMEDFSKLKVSKSKAAATPTRVLKRATATAAKPVATTPAKKTGKKPAIEDVKVTFKDKTVAELRKVLRERGLTTTGNKTELLERLQEAIASGVEVGAGGAEDDFDEEEILAGEDGDDVSAQEEEAALKGGAKAIKKVGVTAKKATLKRSTPVAAASPAKKEAASKQNKENTEDEPTKKVAKIGDTQEKAPLESRAERFGLPKTDAVLKEARTARFGGTTNGTSKRAPKLSMETGGLDVDKLKKRAERFGEVTSKSLTKLEKDSKLKERSDRFASNTIDSTKKIVLSSSTDDDAKPATNGETKAKITAPVGKGGPEDATKKKRAERFAV